MIATLTSGGALERAALDYADRGWLVLPAVDKMPHARIAPHGLRSASGDPDVIRSWWRSEPNANIAIACRTSGLLAIDVDERHGGHDTYHDLEQQLGEIPLTPRSLTGGGGLHVLVANPGLTTRASAGQGVDVRDRAMVIAPPSRHQSGRTYEWEIDPEEVAPTVLPPSWRQHLTRRTHPKRQDGPIPQGCRNSTLTQMAGSLRRAGIGTDGIEAALLQENRRRCHPPLPTREVQAIARSIGRRDAAPAWKLDAVGYVAHLADTGLALTATQRHVLTALLHRAKDGGWVLGGRWIENETGLSHGAVSTAIRALENHGLATVKRQHRRTNQIQLDLPEAPVAPVVPT